MTPGAAVHLLRGNLYIRSSSRRRRACDSPRANYDLSMAAFFFLFFFPMQQQAPSLARSEQRLTFINHAPFLRIDSAAAAAAATALGSHIVYGAQIAHYGAKSLGLIWRPPPRAPRS